MNEIGGASSTYGESKALYGVSVGKPWEGDYSEDPDVDKRIILRRIFRKRSGRLA